MRANGYREMPAHALRELSPGRVGSARRIEHNRLHGRASLRTRYLGVHAALAAAGIARDTVVAYVHPEQWVALHAALIR